MQRGCTQALQVKYPSGGNERDHGLLQKNIDGNVWVTRHMGAEQKDCSQREQTQGWETANDS